MTLWADVVGAFLVTVEVIHGVMFGSDVQIGNGVYALIPTCSMTAMLKMGRFFHYFSV